MFVVEGQRELKHCCSYAVKSTRVHPSLTLIHKLELLCKDLQVDATSQGHMSSTQGVSKGKNSCSIRLRVTWVIIFPNM